MLRLLNVVAVAALIGSAVFAYSIKYETILYAEQILKTRHLIAAEQDGIERLRAEWAILTRPDRLAALSTQGLNLQRLSLDQIVDASALPDPPPTRSIRSGGSSSRWAFPNRPRQPADKHASGSAATPGHHEASVRDDRSFRSPCGPEPDGPHPAIHRRQSSARGSTRAAIASV